MNIFQFLGLPSDWRKETKVTQLVKHYDEVIPKHTLGKAMAGQVKKDGVCAITLVREGRVQIFSRTGKLFTNTMYVVAKIQLMNLPTGVYFGEMWCPKSIASLETVSGATNPNRVNPLEKHNRHVPGNLDMSFFDLISIEEFIKGKSDSTFIRRHSILTRLVHDAKFTVPRDEVVGIEVLPYFLLETEQQKADFANEHIDTGEEGVIYCQLHEGWVAGHKGYRKMKRVRGVDYDLLCVGFENGTGKASNIVANLLFKWKDGKTIKCSGGKGWNYQMLEEMLVTARYCARKKSPSAEMDNPVGKIFQVYALEESSKGKLRLPKFGEIRHDKDTSDV